MNNTARTLELLLAVDRGESWTITAFSDRVGSKATAKRQLSALADQGYQLLPGPRWDGYRLALACPLDHADRQAIRAALAYERSGLPGLVRALSPQQQIPGL